MPPSGFTPGDPAADASPPLLMSLLSEFSPWLYGLLLTAAVGLGLPAGVLMLTAGLLYGGVIGLAVVLIGEALGLTLNWRLCRGLLRPRVQRWLARPGCGSAGGSGGCCNAWPA